MKRKTTEQFIAEARAVHGDKYDYSKVEYVGAHNRVIIICPIHGEFEQIAQSHVNGFGCRACAIALSKSSVFGIGINDTNIQRRDKTYITWYSMISRCYSHKSLHKNPTYVGCSVCDEWLYLSNFKKWFDANYVEGYDLDKDLIAKSNKVYSPDTCCFIPHAINTVIAIKRPKKGILPIGVAKCNRGYQAKIGKSRKVIGFYKTPEAAFLAYKEAKENYVKELAEKYYKEGKITERVYLALLNYRVEITD